MSNYPKISIIVPVYKVQQYLSDFFKCIKNQTNKDFEVVIVDDGSPDNSGSICDDFAKDYDNVKVIHKRNGGVSSARNEGIKNSRGEWILFFDPDDVFNYDAIDILRKFIDTYCDIDWIIFNYQLISSRGSCSKGNHGVPTNIVLDKTGIDKYIYTSILRKENLLRSPWTKAYRRSVIVEHNIYFTDRTFAEDYEFNLKYLKVVNKILAISDCLYSYCLHGASAVSRYHSQAIRIWLKDTKDELHIISRLEEFPDSFSTKIYIQQKLSSLAHFVVAEQINSNKFKESLQLLFTSGIVSKLNDLNKSPISQPWQLFRQSLVTQSYWKVSLVTWLIRIRLYLKKLGNRIKNHIS